MPILCTMHARPEDPRALGSKRGVQRRHVFVLRDSSTPPLIEAASTAYIRSLGAGPAPASRFTRAPPQLAQFLQLLREDSSRCDAPLTPRNPAQCARLESAHIRMLLLAKLRCIEYPQKSLCISFAFVGGSEITPVTSISFVRECLPLQPSPQVPPHPLQRR